MPVVGRAETNTLPSMFPFVDSWDATPAGSAIDVSRMNDEPAGANGRILVKDGHFAEANTGRRVRFLGMCFGAPTDFPSHPDAERVALRLARMGVNIIRIHHEDWRTIDHASDLWEPGIGPARFSSEGRDRLDYLIAQLKKNGIYVDLNLHTSRT